MNVVVRAVAAALVCCLLAAQAAMGAAVDLSPSGGYAAGSDLAVDSSGDAVVVWQLGIPSRPGTPGVQAAIRSAGATFGGPVTLSLAGEYAIGPKVAIDDGGEAVAVWDQAVSSGNYLVRAAWRAAGGTFGTPVTISASSTQTPAVRVAIDSAGDAIAVWSLWTASGGITQAAIRPASTGTWQPAQTLTDAGETVAPLPPDVAIDHAGDALAVWENSAGGERAAYRPAGQTFGSAFDLGSGDQPLAALDAGGGETVIWAGTDAKLHARTGRGGTFAPQFDLSGPDVNSPYVLAVDAAGDTVSAWAAMNGSVLQAAFLPVGGNQPSVATLDSGGANPAAALDPAGDATVVWEQNNPGYRTIRAAFRPAGGSFGAPFDLTSPGEDATAAAVAFDQAGNAIYIWHRLDASTGNEILQALLPTPGPTGLPPTGPPPPGGCVPRPGLPPCPPGQPPRQPPRLRLLRLTPGTFSTAGRLVHGHCVSPTNANRASPRCTRPIALRVTFTLPAAATVTFSVQRGVAGRLSHRRCVATAARNRRTGRCTRLITLPGRTVRHAHAGRNRFTYTRRGLWPGSYRLIATPSANGKSGSPVSTSFTIVA